MDAAAPGALAEERMGLPASVAAAVPRELRQVLAAPAALGRCSWSLTALAVEEKKKCSYLKQQEPPSPL